MMHRNIQSPLTGSIAALIHCLNKYGVFRFSKLFVIRTGKKSPADIFPVTALILCALVHFAGCAPATHTRDAAIAPGRERIVRAAWLSLADTKSACEDYDYFPGGGMRNMYCHLLNFATWQDVLRLAEMPVFLSGPHMHTTLDLDNPREFGHYNPVFVSRLAGVLLPGIRDREFLAQTRHVYDSCLRPLARTFLVTRCKMRITAVWTQREIDAWQNNMARPKPKRWFYERYYDFLEGPANEGEYSEQDYLGNFDGNVVKTCVGFWIRREIDGTAAEFEKALTALMTAYDRDYLEKVQRAYRL